MNKNIWIISQSNSHTLAQIISDNLILLGLIDNLKFLDHIDDEKALSQAVKGLSPSSDTIVYFIFEDKNLSRLTLEYCIKYNLKSVDVYKLAFSYFHNIISSKANHENISILPEDSKEDFLEFALDTDDGKRPNKLAEADFVIIGISRTTKTPLSLYLSNQGYKVSNLPLIPEVKVPEELYTIDKNKIFALEIEPNRLLSIRKERLKALGLPADSIYASIDRIKDEIKYARGIIDKLGCRTIDVSSISIEETADVIINTI